MATKYLKLNQPTPGSQQWGDALNVNMDIIDAKATSLQGQINQLQQNDITNLNTGFTFNANKKLFISYPYYYKEQEYTQEHPQHKPASIRLLRSAGGAIQEYIYAYGTEHRGNNLTDLATNIGLFFNGNLLKDEPTGVDLDIIIQWYSDLFAGLTITKANDSDTQCHIYAAQLDNQPNQNIINQIADYHIFDNEPQNCMYQVSCGYIQISDDKSSWIELPNTQYNTSVEYLVFNSNNVPSVPVSTNNLITRANDNLPAIVMQPSIQLGIYEPKSWILEDNKLKLSFTYKNAFYLGANKSISLVIPSLPHIGSSIKDTVTSTGISQPTTITTTIDSTQNDIRIEFFTSSHQHIVVDYSISTNNNKYNIECYLPTGTYNYAIYIYEHNTMTTDTE